MKSPDDKHKLIIDDEVAPIVMDIFAWKAEGMSDPAIARRLNETGIPSPAKRQVERGDVKKTNRNKLFIWRDRSIRMITTSPMYIGHMTQGRTKQALCENRPLKEQEKSDWIITPNTHAPIVSEEIFQKAQEARLNNTRPFFRNYDKSKHIKNEKHLFKGLLYCKDCGSKLQRVKRDNAGKRYFVCPLKQRNLGLPCSSDKIYETVLHEIALKSIKVQIALAADITKTVERLNKIKAANSDGDSLAERISALQREMKRLVSLKSELYETYADKLLTESEYIYSKQKYEEQIIAKRRELERLQEESVRKSETLTPKNNWIQAFRRFTDHDELSYEMIRFLINRIVVDENGEPEFVWNFKNEYEAIREYAEVAK